MTFQYCRCKLKSLKPLVTLELSSIASCHYCQTGFFHLRQLRPAVRSMTTTAAKTAVQAFIRCRLDYWNSMLYSMSDGLGLVHPECSHTSGHRNSTMRPHHAGAASAALAACPSTSLVQGCMPGTPVSGWSDTRIHSRQHPTCYVIAVSYVQLPPGHASFHGRTTT